MIPEPQQPKGSGGTPSSLNVAIEAMNFAREVSNITPAKAVFGSVSILLTMIRVRFLRLREKLFWAHKQLGLDGERTGIRRAWVNLCHHLRSPRPGDERKAIGRVQSVRVRRDKSIDDVS